MEITTELLNLLFEKYKGKIDLVAEKNQYPNNITHLLYLMIPAFILRYGVKNETMVLKCLEEIPIVISPREDLQFQAFYYCIPKRIQEQWVLKRGITLNHYQNTSLMQLLDNLVHEMNHAMNSLYQPWKEEGDKFYIRSGLVYFEYQRPTLKFLKKSNSTFLEEIINTKQTEEIIDIINSFNQKQIENIEIENTLYAIRHSINQQFESNAYGLQKEICRELLQNKTFITTIENFRLLGNVEDLDLWFDTITGKSGSYQQLLQILNRTYELQIELGKKSFFAGRKKAQLRGLIEDARKIVLLFNQNCNFK